MIEQERIEAVKAGVDLVAVIRSRGIELKRNGKGYVGRCPFHADENPSLSVSPREKLWKCFGCGAGGDVIRFIELFDKIGFREAVAKLSGSASGPASSGTRKPSGKGKAAATPQQLPASDRVGAEAPHPTDNQATSSGAAALPARTNARPAEAGHPAQRAGPAGSGAASSTPPAARSIKLLARVIEFYHTAFAEDGRAREYLASRGISDNALFSTYKIGFANGTLLNVLPEEGDLRRELNAIGVLNDKGGEHFYGCVIFPLLDLNGHPAGIYGRRIEAMAAEGPAHLYLPGPRRGLFNPAHGGAAAKANREIILTEAVIDALTLIHAGLTNTIPCYGTNGFTDEHLGLFRQCGVETLYLAFDADEPGRNAAGKLASRLEAEGFAAHLVNLPDGEDVNSFFSLTAAPGLARERFVELIQQANPGPGPEVSDPGPAPEMFNPGSKAAVKEKTGRDAGEAQGECPAAAAEDFLLTDYGFAATLSGHRYEVRGISRAEGKLKATVKAVGGDPKKRRFHVDTVDFYSARSRAYLARGLGDLFSVPEAALSRDLERLTELAEAWREKDTQAPPAPEMSAAAKDEALAFLKNPELFQEILADFEALGVTGEETNKLLCYLAAVSRKMDEPLSVMIQSRSAAGKSFLQDTVLSLIPEDEAVKYTRLTDQALFYKEKSSLKHKILAIEELDGMNGAMYSIRSIQSSRKITIAYTGKDPVTGKLRTDDNTVEGPLMIFITTTSDEIDGETASRFIFLSIDESSEMTERVLQKQRDRHTMAGMLGGLKTERVIAKHQNANRLLKPVRIVNPYAGILTFSSRSLRARRDHTKYLNLIRAVTCLFQYQRKPRVIEHEGSAIEYIAVTLADIAKANAIAGEVLGRSLDELAPPSRRLLGLIRDLVSKHSLEKEVPPEAYRFTRRDIRHFSGWSDFQVKTHVRQLEDLEYIYPVMGKKGKEYVYELLATGEMTDDRPFLMGLTPIDELRQKAREAGINDE